MKDGGHPEKVELKFFTRISFFLKKRGKNILVIITFTTILGVIGVISYKIFFPGHLSQSAEAVFSSPLTFKAFRGRYFFRPKVERTPIRAIAGD